MLEVTIGILYLLYATVKFLKLLPPSRLHRFCCRTEVNKVIEIALVLALLGLAFAHMWQAISEAPSYIAGIRVGPTT